MASPHFLGAEATLAKKAHEFVGGAVLPFRAKLTNGGGGGGSVGVFQRSEPHFSLPCGTHNRGGGDKGGTR